MGMMPYDRAGHISHGGTAPSYDQEADVALFDFFDFDVPVFLRGENYFHDRQSGSEAKIDADDEIPEMKLMDPSDAKDVDRDMEDCVGPRMMWQASEEADLVQSSVHEMHRWKSDENLQGFREAEQFKLRSTLDTVFQTVVTPWVSRLCSRCVPSQKHSPHSGRSMPHQMRPSDVSREDLEDAAPDDPFLGEPCSSSCAQLRNVDPTALTELVTLLPAEPVIRLSLFLEASQGNVNVATARLREHITWRGINTPVPKAGIADSLACKKMFTCGVDRCGRPILLFLGFRNVKGNVETDIRVLTFYIEEAIASMADGVHQILILIFMPEGSPPDVSFLLAARALANTHYPGRFDKCLVFPTNWATSFVWSAVSHVLSQETLDLVHFMPPEGGSQPPELLDFIAPDQLLVSFGGQRQEPEGSSIEDDHRRYLNARSLGRWL